MTETVQVHPKGGVPDGFVGVEDRPVAVEERKAGCVDQVVQGRTIKGGKQIRRIIDEEVEHRVLDARGQVLWAGLDVGREHLHPVGRQPGRGGQPDAAARTRDQRGAGHRWTAPSA